MKIKIIIDYDLMMKLLPPENPNEQSKIFDKTKIINEASNNVIQVQAYENDGQLMPERKFSNLSDLHRKNWDVVDDFKGSEVPE